MKINDIIKATKYDLERLSKYGVDLWDCAIAFTECEDQDQAYIYDTLIYDVAFNKTEKSINLIVDDKLMKKYFNDYPVKPFTIKTFYDIFEMKKKIYEEIVSNLIDKNIHILTKAAVALILKRKNIDCADLKIIENYALNFINSGEKFDISHLVKKFKKKK